MTLPISTTNITGFFIMVSGLSFVKASSAARRMIFASHRGLWFFAMDPCLKCPSSAHEQMFENRTEGECREERKGADDQNYADQQHGEKWRMHREGPMRGRHQLLLGEV